MARRTENGQAAVELIAVLPFVLLVVAVLWQMAVAGHAASLAGSAARAAARASAVGGDARSAARRVVPRRFRRGLQVIRSDDGSVRVRVAIPAVIGGRRLGRVQARAHFPPQSE